jgi:glutamine synthetase
MISALNPPVRFESTRFSAFYEIDSIEGNWNTGRDEGPNLGYKPRPKEGYFPVPPMDKFQDLRTEMVLTLEALGIETEAQHHEVATAGQGEIDMRFKPLLQMSDQLMWFKYVLKNVAYRHNHTVTFMPKPIFEDNGTGMHTHISIWKENQPLFAGDKYAGISQEALYGIGGILNTSAWYRVLKPRSIWRTPAATAVLLFVFRCIRHHRKPNASSSEPRIHPATGTWHFRPC